MQYARALERPVKAALIAYAVWLGIFVVAHATGLETFTSHRALFTGAHMRLGMALAGLLAVGMFVVGAMAGAAQTSTTTTSSNTLLAEGEIEMTSAGVYLCAAIGFAVMVAGTTQILPWPI